MHRALSARWLNRALSIGETSASSSVPLFLCPAVGSARHIRTPRVAPSSRTTTLYSRRFNHTEAAIQDIPATETESPPKEAPAEPRRRLPLNCTGCGAFSQTADPQLLGYFDLNSKRVKKWLNPEEYEPKRTASEEDGVVDDVLKTLDQSQLEALGLKPSLLMSGAETEGDVAPSGYISWPFMQLKLIYWQKHLLKTSSLYATDVTTCSTTARRVTRPKSPCIILQ